MVPIAVDSQMVGKASSGTFLMLEVEPGRHRVSTRTSENEDAEVVIMEPDSVYIFKAWPKMGFVSAQAGIERMTLSEGIASVRSARMVVTTWPGVPIVDDGVRLEQPGGQGMP